MKMNAIGLNIRHTGDFSINRPHGSGDNLLLVFKTSALVMVNGSELLVSPDSCILYTKDTPQLYRTAGKTYVNHYLHFNCSREDLTDIDIPFDTPFFLANPKEADDLFTMLTREQFSINKHQQSNLTLLLRLLLQKISDNALSEAPTENVRRQEEFNNLRAEIYSNAGQYNSISELAAKTNLSSSHFQMLYQKQFGISCYDDLLTAKIMNAEHHLNTTNLSIVEIARLCGYENDTCFMRCFKKRIGMTPTQYRRSGQ